MVVVLMIILLGELSRCLYAGADYECKVRKLVFNLDVHDILLIAMKRKLVCRKFLVRNLYQ
jgi:hypothetical protein